MFRLKNVLTTVILAGGVLLTARWAHATDVAYSGTFVGTEGLASTVGTTQAHNYTRDMNTTGDRVSMQIIQSSYTAASSVSFTTSSYVLNTPTITVASNNLITGMAVLYSTGASPAISGLSNQTTYYVSVISPNNNGVSSRFKLASTSTGAVAGVGIVLASSTTATNSYTLAPLAFTNTGTGGIQVQWSDDNSTFFNATTGNYGLAITSVTFSASGTSALYDLGATQHRYLRVKQTAPTTGAVVFTVTNNERYSYGH